MAVPKNHTIFAQKPWSDDQLRVISPISPDRWPEREKPIPACGLTFSEYFTECNVPLRDLDCFNEFIKAIPAPEDIRTSVYATFLNTFAEIEQCKETLAEEAGKHDTKIRIPNLQLGNQLTIFQICFILKYGMEVHVNPKFSARL